MTAISKVYSTTNIRVCEQYAINTLNISADALMLKAGQASFELLKKKFSHVRSIGVFTGGGNNAGDGFILAKLAKEEGFDVLVYQTVDIEDLPPAAYNAALMAVDVKVPFVFFEESIDEEVELIVDALLGIGFKGQLKEPALHCIRNINESVLPVLSLDVPSGLNADTGVISPTAVKANLTVTFIGAKPGLYTLHGQDYAGEIICATLNLQDCLESLPPAAVLLDKNSKNPLIPRVNNSHKGLYGHVLVVGGGYGMPGAVHLAATAAYRAGAGVVSVATLPEYAMGALPGLPEALVFSIEDAQDLDPLLQKATVVIIGPGLGLDEWAENIFTKLVSSQLPLVIDACALRILAKNAQYDDNWILTPHPGEACALLNLQMRKIHNDRLRSAYELQQQYGGSIILKGSGTVINTGHSQNYICTSGNPGMASAGMGDVLSGILGALLAQGLSIEQAATFGVLIHGQAGDDALIHKGGARGLIASDLMPFILRRVNSC